MSIFSELIPKLNEISNAYSKNFQDDLKVALEFLEKFEEEYLDGKKGKEKTQKDKLGTTTLQSINEDDGEPNKIPENSSRKSNSSQSADSNGGWRASKKRNKYEAEDISSPEVDKRLKRNASVKAQSIITKQVNVNLSAKMRREKSTDVEKASDKPDKSSQAAKGRRQKADKENAEPNAVPTIKIKEEKVSLPPEPMDTAALAGVALKQEPSQDDAAMPPPAMPVPKPRKAIPKDKSDDSADEETGGRRSARSKRKQAEPMPPPPPPPPPVAATRATRASSRATRQAEADEAPLAVAATRATRASSRAPRQTEADEAPVEARPKRTRAKKKASVSESQSEADSMQTSQTSVSAAASPAEKPRPKRTRRGKAAEKPEPKPLEPTPISPNEVPTSPILQEVRTMKDKSERTFTSTQPARRGPHMDETLVLPNKDVQHMNATVVIEKLPNETMVIEKLSNETMVIEKLSNETMVIEKLSDETVVIEKAQNAIMDATVVLHKGTKPSNMTEDDSLLTDDEGERAPTPPLSALPQPESAVKEKVQQFEQMASRVTRTKTRALARQDEFEHTPPDKVSQPGLSAETLTKMNSLIFNGKPQQQISMSASKPCAAPPAAKGVLLASASASKLSAVVRHREAADEDARKKKEAMLEARKELHKRKREEKMAAAAQARNNAERERRAQLELAARERLEKQAHADLGKLERLKEAERKKQDLARKVAETEERRRAEEAVRAQRLADEQRRALAQRRKQIEEQEAIKEAAIMAKEIEKRQKEYMDKQKMKLRLEEKALRTAGTPGGRAPVEPVYMADGFQFLNSDSDEEPPPRPSPDWSTSKARNLQLDIQSQLSCVHVDRLFSVRVHSPDLRDIFPNIERARLKRTSSAVWRTPPQHHAPLQ